jgi:hypothetical protein
MPGGCYERKALEDLKGADYLQAGYRMIFPRRFSYRGTFTVKTGCTMFVKRSFLRQELFQWKKWSDKIPFEPGNSGSFPEDKT